MSGLVGDGRRECRRCGGRYHAVAFRVSRALSCASTRRSSVCVWCEFEPRQAIKDARRAIVKAQRTIRTHAAKYIKKGLCGSVEQFVKDFCWDAKQMAHDIEHAFANGCPYCRVQFASMHGGLHNVSLDVINPETPPFYGSNTKWVCKTCNSMKGDLSPEDWGQKLSDRQSWERQQKLISKNKWAVFPLFRTNTEA